MLEQALNKVVKNISSSKKKKIELMFEACFEEKPDNENIWDSLHDYFISIGINLEVK